MPTAGYVALLRAINVGGRNKIAMGDLREALTGNRYLAVTTYIQSGNVLFDAEPDVPADALEADIETILSRRFAIPVVVFVRSHVQLAGVIDDAPDGFGQAPGTYHSDVIFLKASLPSHRARQLVDPREGVDQVWAGDGVLYVQRLSARRTQSRLSRIIGIPEYAQMTIRNWSTTTKLRSLLDERSRA